MPEPAPAGHLTVNEVAADLGVHHRTVRKRINDGELPAVNVGTGRARRLYISRDALEQYRANRVRPVEPIAS